MRKIQKTRSIKEELVKGKEEQKMLSSYSWFYRRKRKFCSATSPTPKLSHSVHSLYEIPDSLIHSNAKASCFSINSAVFYCTDAIVDNNIDTWLEVAAHLDLHFLPKSTDVY